MQLRLHNLPRDSRDTLFLLLVIAWVLLPQTVHLPLWCNALAAAVLLWRGWLAVTAKPLPSRRWLMLVLTAAIGGTLASHQTLLGRDAGVTLLVVLLTLKTLELRARRDAFVIFFLGFFCMLSNFFYSQSLPIAFSMVIGLLGLLTVLVNAHMPVGKPPLGDAARTAGLMALLGAPIMMMLFLLFPRLAPLWGVPSDAMAGRSGLSASMRVGTIASLALDDSVAMRIKFEGRPPAQHDLYFRGPVLSDFNGLEWQPQRTDLGPRERVSSNLQVAGAPVGYEVTLEATNRPWLFVMEAAAEKPLLPGYRLMMQDDLQWLVDRPLTDLVRYKVQSFPAFRHGPSGDVAGLRRFAQLPAGFNPRTLALAARIRNDPGLAPGNAARVRVVMQMLRSGGYTYTLEPGVYGRNTADEFWFDRKEGFCEHIASSFVILMRALGVPARIVTGYQGGEQNSVDGFWVVRQSDAHAWAEVWYEGRGWVRVDPTSAVSPGRTGAFQRLTAPRGVMAQTLLGNLSPGFTAQIQATWDAVNNAWNQRVLSYTQGRQLDLLRDIGFESPSWADLAYVLIIAIVVAALAGACWTVWDRVQHDPWLRLLARARKKLAKAGIESLPSSSPRQLASLLEARFAAGTGANTDAARDWLLQLEMQRYAAGSGHKTDRTVRHSQAIVLQQLKRRFNALPWPA